MKRKIVNWEEVVNEIKMHDLMELRIVLPELAKAKRLRYRKWKMLCPFHDENTPSFNYFETSGTWCCYGCSLTGSIIDFYARAKQISFGEATRELAKFFKIKFQWENKEDVNFSSKEKH